MPTLTWKPDSKIVLAFDPARTYDNSILGVMNVYEDPEYGLCGDIINCISLIDTATTKKYKLDSNRQIDIIRDTLLLYNGQNPDYEYIDSFLVDSGAGGGGVSTYADSLLNNWKDRYGKEHRGLIDASNELYSTYSKRYPDAVDKLRLISPRKYRTQMVEEFIELMNLGVIRFPYEYGGNDFVKLKSGVDKINGDELFTTYDLSKDEKQALTNIDLMKNEITSIHKFTNQENTSVTYALSKEKERKMHDDRFFVAILLAHRLYELRRGSKIAQQKTRQSSASMFSYKTPLTKKKGR